MNQEKAGKKQSSWKWLGVAGVVLVIAALALWASRSYFTNYAEKVAKPIEKALIEAGAVKISSSGDAGRGVDNREPWYSASFKSTVDKPAALDLIKEIAKENGYNLIHADPDNRGPLGAVADIYIDNWYFDNTSKIANFPGVPEEPIQLMMAVNYEGSQTSGADNNHAMIRLDVRLPSFR